MHSVLPKWNGARVSHYSSQDCLMSAGNSANYWLSNVLRLGQPRSASAKMI